MFVVWDDLTGGPARIEIMRRDGVVVSELNNPSWPPEFAQNLGDVAYLAANTLLVTAFDAGIWTMNFSGNILSGPVAPGGGIGEGIVQTGDGRIVATNYPQNLISFDSSLNRQPESDRADIVGLNLNTATGVAWNPDTNRLLIAHDMPGYAGASSGIAAVPVSLDSAIPIVDTSAFPFGRQLTYLPGEHLIAMTHSSPRRIVLFNSDGSLNSQIDLSPAALGQNLGPPNAITYIPTTNEFAVSFNGALSDPNRTTVQRTLHIFSRTGTLLRTLDLKETGTGVIAGLAYYVDSAGNEQFLILGSLGRVIITDLNGSSRNSSGLLIGEFNLRVKLGLIERIDLAAITTGPMAGAFAMLGNRGGEVVIFRLD